MGMHKRLVSILLGLLLLLVVRQESAGQEKKPSDAVKTPSLPVDPKAVDSPEGAASAAALLESAYRGTTPPEAVRMLIAILKGSQLGADSGWFGPADSRYSWKWLADRCGVDPTTGGIPRTRFRGSDAAFTSLDRNNDGTITASDLDWSDHNPDVQMAYMANRLFRRLNEGGNGRLTREELLRFFEKASRGKDHISPDDFRDAVMGGMSGGFLPGDAPTKTMLIRGLFSGELGSINEGPQLEQAAPNFTLKTVDGKETVQLSKLIGSKPVVLVLGNFTCGPFRSYYASVESVYQRHKKDAHFLMVYVREAHPTDGWKMESNTRVGVAVQQPTTLEERVTVAGKFCERLKPTMPVVVDDVNDVVGHAYSGMPARLYVIDTQGKIAYKSGRGPFGFRVGEMEQALVMALLEQQPASKP